MVKTELFTQLGLDVHFSGDCFLINLEKNKTVSEDNIIELLDIICRNENLKCIGNGWKFLTFDQGSEFLNNALNYDIVYQTYEIVSLNEAHHFRNQILKFINEDNCICLTNWIQNPWKNNNNGGWTAVTEKLYDMAFVFANTNSMIFIYFTGED